MTSPRRTSGGTVYSHEVEMKVRGVFFFFCITKNKNDEERKS